MRITISVALLLAVCVGPVAHAAPPVLTGARQAPPAPANTTLGSARLHRFLFGEQQPAPPQHPYAAPAPTAGQRVQRALTNNPVAVAWNGGAERRPPAARQDELSLNRPVGAPTIEMFLAMAGVAEQKGDANSARLHFQKALSIDPNSLTALRQYGRFEDRQGRLDEAEKIYGHAVVSNPGHAGALNDLALCFARQSKLQQSKEALDHAIALRPEKPLYRNNIAKVLVALGDDGLAGHHLAAVHPPAVAEFNLGKLLSDNGKVGEAIAHFEQSLVVDPAFAPARAALAQLGPAAIPPQVASRPELPATPLPAPSPQREALTPAGVPSMNLPSLPPTNSPWSPAATNGASLPRLLPPAVNY